MDPTDVFGVGGLATRFAWGGALASMFIWIVAARRIWRVEGSPHHLVARLLSTATMIALDVVVIIFLWPSNIIPRPAFLNLGGEEARALVAFVVGMQIMAAIWQITAPPQGRVTRTPRTVRGSIRRRRSSDV